MHTASPQLRKEFRKHSIGFLPRLALHLFGVIHVSVIRIFCDQNKAYEKNNLDAFDLVEN